MEVNSGNSRVLDSNFDLSFNVGDANQEGSQTGMADDEIVSIERHATSTYPVHHIRRSGNESRFKSV
jgi:hypothetical protein